MSILRKTKLDFKPCIGTPVVFFNAHFLKPNPEEPNPCIKRTVDAQFTSPAPNGARTASEYKTNTNQEK